MNGDAGKGDTPRPLSIPIEEYHNHYNRVFNKIMNELKVPKKLLIHEEVGNTIDKHY